MSFGSKVELIQDGNMTLKDREDQGSQRLVRCWLESFKIQKIRKLNLMFDWEFLFSL